jgi:hypothetical protein
MLVVAAAAGCRMSAVLADGNGADQEHDFHNAAADQAFGASDSRVSITTGMYVQAKPLCLIIIDTSAADVRITFTPPAPRLGAFDRFRLGKSSGHRHRLDLPNLLGVFTDGAV